MVNVQVIQRKCMHMLDSFRPPAGQQSMLAFVGCSWVLQLICSVVKQIVAEKKKLFKIWVKTKDEADCIRYRVSYIKKKSYKRSQSAIMEEIWITPNPTQ